MYQLNQCLTNKLTEYLHLLCRCMVGLDEALLLRLELGALDLERESLSVVTLAVKSINTEWSVKY